MSATRRSILLGAAAAPFAAMLPASAAPATDRAAWDAAIAAYHAAKAVDDELGAAYLRAIRGFEADVSNLGPKPVGVRVSGWPADVDPFEAGGLELRQRLAEREATIATLRVKHGVDEAERAYEDAPSAVDALFAVCSMAAPDFAALLEKLDLIEAQDNYQCRDLFEGFAADVRRLAGKAVLHG